MVQTAKAQNIDLRYLIENFGLQRVRNDSFFREWQTHLPELTDLEKQQLDRVQEGYFNLVEYPPLLLEDVVKLAILSPILFIAGFYLAPFHIKLEESIQVREEENGRVIEGKIDILVLKEKLWVTVIESKRLAFSVEEGLAQLLAYLLADPNPETPSYGLITTGASFLFVKLVREDSPKYALSDEFIIRNRGNELYDVLKILKRLSTVS